ncbi:hypothetical protein CB1_000746004 [Camelus ferus]|nr:hypothetical protein CB1_000746004 [Camelus ferus]
MTPLLPSLTCPVKGHTAHVDTGQLSSSLTSCKLYAKMVLWEERGPQVTVWTRANSVCGSRKANFLVFCHRSFVHNRSSVKDQPGSIRACTDPPVSQQPVTSPKLRLVPGPAVNTNWSGRGERVHGSQRVPPEGGEKGERWRALHRMRGSLSWSCTSCPLPGLRKSGRCKRFAEFAGAVSLQVFSQQTMLGWCSEKEKAASRGPPGPLNTHPLSSRLARLPKFKGQTAVPAPPVRSLVLWPWQVISTIINVLSTELTVGKLVRRHHGGVWAPCHPIVRKTDLESSPSSTCGAALLRDGEVVAPKLPASPGHQSSESFDLKGDSV